MKNAFVCMLAGVSVCCFAENLLKNPGFEEKNKQGRIAFWGHNSSLVKISSDSFREKNAVCFHIENTAGKKVTRNVLSQTIRNIKPGSYQFQFYGKTTGDGTLWATWVFTDADGKQIPVKMYWTNALRSAAWRKVTAKVTVPENAVSITFHLLYTLSESDRSGTGYLDEIRLDSAESGNALPEGAKLVYSDSFSGGKISGNWIVSSGKWSVQNGALCGEKNASIFFNGKLNSPNLRMEYTAWSDKPGDLSAWLCGKQNDGYFFGFGTVNNSANKISRGSTVFALRGGTWDNLSDGIRKGVHHHVVVQRNYDQLTLTVDGKKLLEGSDPCFTGCLEPLAGLYIWSSGWIDDVKIYELPYVGSGNVEKKIESQKVWQFDGPEKLKGVSVAVGTGNKIVNIPSHEYKSDKLGLRKVADSVLVLSGKKIQADFNIGNLSSGIVDLDVMSDQEKPFSLELLDQNNRVLASLVVRENLNFYAGKNALRSQIRWTRRRYDVPLKFEPSRWYTLRIHFDFVNGLIRYALLDMYTEIIASGWPEGNLGNYLTLGSIRTKTSNARAVKLRIRADKGQQLYIDNVYAFGPVGGTINGKTTDRSSRDLLGIKQHLRHDPLRLKHFSSRHFPAMNDTKGWGVGWASKTHRAFIQKKIPEYAAFRKAGYLYDTLLIKLAFLDEKLSNLERSCFYDGNSAEALKLSRLKKQHTSLESRMEKALRIYGDAYWDSFNSKSLDAIYPVLESVQKDIREIESKLGKTAFDFPSKVSHDDFKWDFSTRAFVQNGKSIIWPYTFFSFYGHYPQEAELLGYYNPTSMGHTWLQTDSDVRGEYVNHNHWAVKAIKKGWKEKIFLLSFGSPHYPNMIVPKWWLEDHRSDPDIFFCDENGKSFSKPYGDYKGSFLNYWHPEVRKLVDQKYREVGKFVKEVCGWRTKAVFNGEELKNVLPGGAHPGFNRSAEMAFRESMKKKYGTIAKLNVCWGSKYTDFNQIGIPRGKNNPPGLVYEYNRFYQEGFAEWNNAIRKAFHSQSEVPMLSDQQATFGGNDLIEPVSYIRALDIKIYHTYQDWDRRTADRWHGLLTEVLNKRFGSLEWVGAQGSGHMFELEPIKTNMNRELFQQLMWGAAMINTTYGIGYGNWQYGIRIFLPTVDMGVFTYLAGSIAVTHDRIRRFGEVALAAKTILPETAILESTTSYYHGYNVRMTMNPIAESLAGKGWDFNVLYENLLMEGTQTLNGVKFIWLPQGKCLPATFRKQLFDWVKNGGVLASVGTMPGIADEFGKPVKNYSFTIRNMKERQIFNYGKGRIVYLPSVPKDPAAFMAECVEKNVGSDNTEFQFRFCEWKNKKYLFVVNWSMKREKGTLFVPGVYVYNTVRDLGLLRPVAVKTAVRGNKTFFTTQLEPGEGTLFELTSAK